MKYWTKKFNPDNEDFTCVPVSIRLYSLPQEFWNEEILMGIGNTIGTYVKATKSTKQMCYMAYARICVYMNVSTTIPTSITLSYEVCDWLQSLDYEFIPFRCHHCHEHGHLFRECPLTQFKKATPNPPKLDLEGFTTVTRNKKSNAKHHPS